MKILPPERKLADCPLMAMMFGSASTRTRPSRFFASTPSSVEPRDSEFSCEAAADVAPLVTPVALFEMAPPARFGLNRPRAAAPPPKIPRRSATRSRRPS